MIGELFTLDTNILVYSIDRDAGSRHTQAVRVVKESLDNGSCTLTLQVLSEFFYSATRKGKVSLTAAGDHIADWMTLVPTVNAQPSTLQKAIKGVKDYQLAFWDAFLWATAKESGITKILTEDFQHGREIEGVHYLNPFLPS